MNRSSKKLLVANRSEIACRIFQAAQEMGLATVALCAPGDENAKHVTEAQVVLPVPSYLDADSIVREAKKAGVDLIHPGYGFLSERSHFVRAVEAAGMGFLGPKPETMEALGGKIAAKEIAESLGIPTVPWAKIEMKSQSDDQLRLTALSAAKQAGDYPVLIKAHAGGGGKGMRVVRQESELMELLESAGREAQSSFGDGTLFFEKYIEGPRHIEVQVFGDGRGNGVHFFERECSLQRRHQKVWEEAPALRLPEATRQGLWESSLKLVRAMNYRSAGTVEYLVDEKGNYYFIEMNTRLQVEHPVSECITGFDLVHEQIELALLGDAYAIPDQGAVQAQGHAIEVRVYSEDPAQEFRPCTGVVSHLVWPSGPGIRVDRGIEVSQEIGTLFDAMCAKIIVHAPTRALAIKRMQYALNQTLIAGVGTNLEYLTRLAYDPKVVSGVVTTKTLDQEYQGFKPELSAFAASVLTEVLPLSTGSGEFRRNTGSLQESAQESLWRTVKL